MISRSVAKAGHSMAVIGEQKELPGRKANMRFKIVIPINAQGNSEQPVICEESSVPYAKSDITGRIARIRGDLLPLQFEVFDTSCHWSARVIPSMTPEDVDGSAKW